MKILISTANSDEKFYVDVWLGMHVSALRAIISKKCGRPENTFSLMKDGKPLDDSNNTLMNEDFKEGDHIVLVPTAPPSTASAAKGYPGISFANIKVRDSNKMPRIDPPPAPTATRLPSQPQQRNPASPELPAAFREMLASQSPFGFPLPASTDLTSAELDPNVQSRIAEIIRQRNIDMMMENTLDHYPEMFAPVTMLFIKCKVNQTPLVAFVDSGAQSTIMSEDCAQRCNLESLIDRRYEGIAFGVGTQTIVGRVHNSTLEIDTQFLPTSFVILKNQQMDLLLGLDMLRRHQCCIDLKRNVLRVGEGHEVPFLSESEVAASNQMLTQPFQNESTAGTSSQSDTLSHYSMEERKKIEHLIGQGVPIQRAIQELQANSWDVHNALISYMSSEDAL